MILEFLHEFIRTKLTENDLLHFVHMAVNKENFRIIITLKRWPIIALKGNCDSNLHENGLASNYGTKDAISIDLDSTSINVGPLKGSMECEPDWPETEVDYADSTVKGSHEYAYSVGTDEPDALHDYYRPTISFNTGYGTLGSSPQLPNRSDQLSSNPASTPFPSMSEAKGPRSSSSAAQRLLTSDNEDDDHAPGSSESSRWRCDTCQNVFNSRDQLRAHEKVHPLWRCDKCPITFKKKTNYRAHLKRHLAQNIRRALQCVWSCGDCRKTFTRRSGLMRHKRKRSHSTPSAVEEMMVKLDTIQGMGGAELSDVVQTGYVAPLPLADSTSNMGDSTFPGQSSIHSLVENFSKDSQSEDGNGHAPSDSLNVGIEHAIQDGECYQLSGLDYDHSITMSPRLPERSGGESIKFSESVFRNNEICSFALAESNRDCYDASNPLQGIDDDHDPDAPDRLQGSNANATEVVEMKRNLTVKQEQEAMNNSSHCAETSPIVVDYQASRESQEIPSKEGDEEGVAVKCSIDGDELDFTTRLEPTENVSLNNEIGEGKEMDSHLERPGRRAKRRARLQIAETIENLDAHVGNNHHNMDDNYHPKPFLTGCLKSPAPSEESGRSNERSTDASVATGYQDKPNEKSTDIAPEAPLHGETREEDAVPSKKSHKCPHCDYASSRKYHVTRHARQMHGVVTVERRKNERKKPTKKKPTESKKSERRVDPRNAPEKRQCDECGYVCLTKRRWIYHIKQYHCKVFFKCSQCDYVAKRKEMVKDHTIRRHTDPTERKLKCAHCDFTAKLPEMIRIHTRRVHLTAGNEFHCEQCDFKTTRNINLRHHVEGMHALKRPFECPKEGCDKTFPTQRRLYGHVRAHNPRISCPECDIKCHSPAELRKHSFKHTGVKKQVCRLCQAKFAHMQNFIRHFTIHHPGEMALHCKTCDLFFANGRSLNKHKTTLEHLRILKGVKEGRVINGVDDKQECD